MNTKYTTALLLGGIAFFATGVAMAQTTPLQAPAGPTDPFSLPRVEMVVGGGDGDWVGALRILGMLTVLTMAPAILLTMTCFTRIVIVFSFLRQALGTQQSPPNQVMAALALFLTVFIMQPVWSKVNQEALQPYMAGTMSQTEAFDKAMTPIRGFMFNHTREKDLGVFIKAVGGDKPQSRENVSNWQLIPAFVLSELKTAFQMGFMLYVPFLVLDMVVASILMAMGMMMLPPILISLPFKVMLVLVDGWNLLVVSLIRSFGGMTANFVVTFFQEAITVAGMLSLPALLLGLVVGLMVAVFQAVTQIQEQTLAFIPKIIAIVAASHLAVGCFLTLSRTPKRSSTKCQRLVLVMGGMLDFHGIYAVFEPWILSFGLAMVRGWGIVHYNPIFNMTMIPTVIKAAMVALLTMLVMTNQQPIPHVAQLNAVALFGAVIIEACVGGVMGLAVMLLFGALAFTGQLIGVQMGFAIAMLLTPPLISKTVC